jgi:hypothetical protein
VGVDRGLDKVAVDGVWVCVCVCGGGINCVK